MKLTTRIAFQALILSAAAMLNIVPTARAVEFRVSTLQERADETVEIENDVIETFRMLQQEQLGQPIASDEPTTPVAELELASLETTQAE